MAPPRCTYPRCENDATHHVVLILRSGYCDAVQKCTMQDEKRCESHQPDSAEAFITRARWNVMASRFAAASRNTFGKEALASRTHTQVAYVPLATRIEDCAVYEAVPGLPQ